VTQPKRGAGSGQGCRIPALLVPDDGSGRREPLKTGDDNEHRGDEQRRE